MFLNLSVSSKVRKLNNNPLCLLFVFFHSIWYGNIFRDTAGICWTAIMKIFAAFTLTALRGLPAHAQQRMFSDVKRSLLKVNGQTTSP